jgi:hypothetical protein
VRGIRQKLFKVNKQTKTVVDCSVVSENSGERGSVISKMASKVGNQFLSSFRVDRSKLFLQTRIVRIRDGKSGFEAEK